MSNKETDMNTVTSTEIYATEAEARKWGKQVADHCGWTLQNVKAKSGGFVAVWAW